MHGDVRFFSLLSFLSFISLSQAFYIPGWSIKSYSDGEAIPLFWNKVYSDKTQLQYAYSELPFICPPSGRKNPGTKLVSGSKISLSLGEVLRGDRIMVSDYELTMGNDEEARYLCSHKIDRPAMRKAQAMIRDGYVAEWIVDNLPGATKYVTTDKSRMYYASGFKLGHEDYSPDTGKSTYYIHNHVDIMIRYHRAPGRDGDRGKKVIVGFEIYTKSLSAAGRNETGLPADTGIVDDGFELRMTPNVTGPPAPKYADSSYIPPFEEEPPEDDDATLTIPYTYSVYFREEEKVDWANRWDLYFKDSEDNTHVHWLAIINSLIISGLLTAVVAVIFARTIRGEIKGYKETSLEDGKIRIKPRKSAKLSGKIPEKGGVLDPLGDNDIDADGSSDEEGLEDATGWKLLHGDVFRPPPYGGLFAPIIGSGTQLLFMAVGLIFLSTVGILNPSYRGGYVTVGLILFVIAGVFSGYYSARVYKTFGGQLWQKNFLVTATLVPGMLFAAVFILNLFCWAQASSSAIPFGTLVALLAMWLLIQLPLVYVGSWFGYNRVGPWEHPIKTNTISRQIPHQSWYTKSIQAVLLAGLIPFAVIFIELLFVFKSLWQDKSGYYYVFGFLAVVSVILALVVIEVTIVATYIQLCSENYHWWWQSFFVGGGSALWVFLYCSWYYMTRLNITGFVSGMLFFSYSFLASAVYGLLTGTIGFLAAYAFVRRIYGAIKVD
ncbi:endomembrane protein 70 [Patellaria atrata CBS 101060]|uniref:Transmembrane 9 superfamily member n=1 Tax=Patellaria atrata CBS 101060 TaxID=1346257 RepID=A0A9P4SAP7_9PEZI|nr:endomembrane protein 70 [Patellaria atrata CBS 101060]